MDVAALILSIIFGLVALYGVVIAGLARRENIRSQKETIALQSEVVAIQRERFALERGELNRSLAPRFRVQFESEPDGDYFWGVRIGCEGELETYDIAADLLEAKPGGHSPPLIFIGFPDQGEQIAYRPESGVFKRLSLGTIRGGESRWYTAQPEPGGYGGEQGLRIVATSPVHPDSSWSSQHTIVVPEAPRRHPR